MTEDKIKNLLQQADQTAGQPAKVSVNLYIIRRRANRRRLVSFAAPLAAAAVVLIAAGIWTMRTAVITREQKKIASLENQVKQLQASTDAAINLIHEVLEEERKQRRLDELEVQLASIPDPLEEIQKQVDKTAFILVYQADRLYRELNQTDSAIENYIRVIELFPKNRWAKVARQRLSEIEKQKI
jgi:TolA-binding protein